MGATIEINTKVLNDLIVQLESKKEELFTYSPEKYDQKGSGLSSDKLIEIENLYNHLKKEIVNLYDKTILYMQGLSQKTDETDYDISGTMNLGG